MPLRKHNAKTRTTKTHSAKNRVLEEMMEMARALQTHALISKQDMAKMKLICEAPPARAPDKLACLTNSQATTCVSP